MAFEAETAYFNLHRAEWVNDGHEGEWVVVHGNQLLGFYQTIENGFEAGVNEFGAGNFLLKKVQLEDRIETIQRVFWGARTGVHATSG